MVHIEKLPSGKWRAIISRGKRQSQTFVRKADADLWAARISGHRDLKILMSVYYRPDVEAWADLLD